MVEGISGAEAPKQPLQPLSHNDLDISQQQINQIYDVVQKLQNLMPALANQINIPGKH